ncbi:MAG: tetratricopeptide repeat protein [Firmicutes bacterium]|nr:tetratricopeptide repeat protein [Bacillota bacterium]
MKKIIIFIIFIIITSIVSANETKNYYKLQIEQISSNIKTRQLKDLKIDKAYHELLEIVSEFKLNEIRLLLIEREEYIFYKIKTLADFITKYPQSRASLLAKYIIGYILSQETDFKSQAEKILLDIIENYPDTMESKIADIALKELKYKFETNNQKKRSYLVDYKNVIEQNLPTMRRKFFNVFIELFILNTVWFIEEETPDQIRTHLRFMLKLGELYELLDDKQKAIEIYNEIIMEYPLEKESDMAKLRIKSLQK